MCKNNNNRVQSKLTTDHWQLTLGFNLSL